MCWNLEWFANYLIFTIHGNLLLQLESWIYINYFDPEQTCMECNYAVCPSGAFYLQFNIKNDAETATLDAWTDIYSGTRGRLSFVLYPTTYGYHIGQCTPWGVVGDQTTWCKSCAGYPHNCAECNGPTDNRITAVFPDAGSTSSHGKLLTLPSGRYSTPVFCKKVHRLQSATVNTPPPSWERA
jgi:hypothetical protein